MPNVDVKTAIKGFAFRYKRNSKEKQINNSDLPAGSPMYYYCKKCLAYITTLPECHFGRAPSLCTACEFLVKQGVIDAAIEYAKTGNDSILNEVIS